MAATVAIVLRRNATEYVWLSFYQAIRLLSRKTVNKYLYLYLYMGHMSVCVCVAKPVGGSSLISLWGHKGHKWQLLRTGCEFWLIPPAHCWHGYSTSQGRMDVSDLEKTFGSSRPIASIISTATWRSPRRKRAREFRENFSAKYFNDNLNEIFV